VYVSHSGLTLLCYYNLFEKVLYQVLYHVFYKTKYIIMPYIASYSL